MIAEICRDLQEQREVRANLIALKEQLKQNNQKEKVLQWEQEYHSLQSFLNAEDAKIRKNAALILGQIGAQFTLDALYLAYESEDTRFVKSSYLTAMYALDCTEYADKLRENYRRLCEAPCKEDEKKHVQEEKKAFEKLLQKLDGGKRHRFCGYETEGEVILTTHPAYREVTAAQIHDGKCVAIPAGVKVRTSNLRELLNIRTFREMLFLTGADGHIEADAKRIAEELLRAGLLEWLLLVHEGEAPFYFRIECRRYPDGERGNFIRSVASYIEELSGRTLLNSTDQYEFEIRLNLNQDNTIFPCVKLYTIPMRRFSYRRASIAASMHPSYAAMLMQLAKPYLAEKAQVLDPFCGVGTLLIERDLLVPSGDMYGTDIFGDAIAGARENMKAAGMNINYINRDFFDFTHKYLFDEIVTDMPMRGRKSKEEQDVFYRRFFEKAAELLRAGGVLVMYSNENGFVKKQLRLRKDFHLKKEFCIREKEGYFLFIIGYKR